jgi:hypothetical protein
MLGKNPQSDAPKETTYFNHELEQVQALLKQTLMGVAVVTFLHFKFSVKPVLVSEVNPTFYPYTCSRTSIWIVRICIHNDFLCISFLLVSYIYIYRIHKYVYIYACYIYLRVLSLWASCWHYIYIVYMHYYYIYIYLYAFFEIVIDLPPPYPFCW